MQKYLNAKKVPQLFIASVSNKWADPANHPWSMGIPVPPRAEATAYARYIRYYPEGSIADNVSGYVYAEALVHVLKQCGDELTRENIMRRATSLKDLELTMPLPGIKVNTSAGDYVPIEQVQLRRFDGRRWVRFGEILGN